NGFSMTNCLGDVKLQLKGIKDDFKLDGQILLKSGVISGPKTAVINIKESKILFINEPKRPMLDLKGLAIVEKVNINIALKGTFDQPELKLTSMPPMDEDRLLLMLATNKTWQSVETAINKQELSADIAKDFLDYFIFSGSGSKISEKYGIRDISVKYNKTTTGVRATKDITDKAALSYSVEQSLQTMGNQTTTQKIASEYKINENISVGAEKELKQNDKNARPEDKQQTDDKVTVKFKKEF
ncbi:MAG: translocation/assembly module TamB, partial [Candidatus Omnitrophica bacterium]|nr:translocation/assembly module TamB [Candidatus Omnitrophota bacterium]